MIALLHDGMEIGLTIIGALFMVILGIAAVFVILAIIGGIIKGFANVSANNKAGGVSDRGVCFDEQQNRKKDDDGE